MLSAHLQVDDRLGLVGEEGLDAEILGRVLDGADAGDVHHISQHDLELLNRSGLAEREALGSDPAARRGASVRSDW